MGTESQESPPADGVCNFDPHVIKYWSSIQQTIVFSSVEVELYALFKCAWQILGIVNFAFDLGPCLQAIVHIDVSAVLAITQRRGFGKFRHIDAPLVVDPRKGVTGHHQNEDDQWQGGFC